MAHPAAFVAWLYLLIKCNECIAAMNALAQRLKPHILAANTIVIHKGGKDTEMYIVVAGAVDIKLELNVTVCARCSQCWRCTAQHSTSHVE
eukprot:SAG31_NODE_6165_length_2141_cov_1.959354_3_plen_91_part_00